MVLEKLPGRDSGINNSGGRMLYIVRRTIPEYMVGSIQ